MNLPVRATIPKLSWLVGNRGLDSLDSNVNFDVVPHTMLRISLVVNYVSQRSPIAVLKNKLEPQWLAIPVDDTCSVKGDDVAVRQ